MPLGSFTTVRDTSGPYRWPRYNLYPSSSISGEAAAGYSSGESIATMERLAARVLPPGFAIGEIMFAQSTALSPPPTISTLRSVTSPTA